MNLRLTLIALCLSLTAVGQETFPVNGTVDKTTTFTAFTNATIQVDPSTSLENATLLIQGNTIQRVGTDVELPANTQVIDLEGLFVYPSFVEPYADYGMPRLERKEWNPRPQFESDKKGAFGWNQAVKPETDAAAIFTHDPKKAKELRALGIGTVLTHQHDGICRGTGAVVALGNRENKDLLIPQASAHYSFNKGVSRQNYPNSLMGSIALLRQTYCDAAWYASPLNTAEENLSLRAFNASQSLPQIFEVDDKLDAIRADLIGDEFGVQYIIHGAGDEYQRIPELQATGATFILPINFPMAYDVSDPFNARLVSLADLKHWELAPSNPARLAEAGIPFVLTSKGASAKNWMKHLRQAIACGLDETTALAALTTSPARLVGAETLVGRLAEGYRANFLIASGELFGPETILHENWVQGERHVISPYGMMDLSGTYDLSIGDVDYNITVSGTPGKHEGSFEAIGTREEDGQAVADTSTVKVKLLQEDRLITLTFSPDDDHFSGVVRLTGNVHSKSRIWDGRGQLPDGTWSEWVAVRQAKEASEAPASADTDSTEATIPELGAITFPLMAYGWEEAPQAETLLIEDATVWTCSDAGVIQKGQVLVHEGKILAVGKDLRWNELLPKGTGQPRVINARGKHVTPGIIDEHSHIALISVNEGSQASSAEVRQGDVVNSDDIHIYRQLAGGVTAAQLLHGSANPIGGQSGLIKFRWGLAPEAMKIENAPGFIKFALGENVKQSNWGDYNTVRFPQTRMGVEQVYYDHFIRAREYDAAWTDYEETLIGTSRRDRRKGNLPDAPRRDLELECLAEILNRDRFVTCHSYQQGEINMLMHVADSMGFTLNTFTHILEGYKVADKMREHGAAGSSFSDWWAYKYEVKDAIPYNGALLWEQGVLTAFNSDDREMARRLNQEAAKAVKYGGVPEEEALKFVTLNPAKMLHLDDRMGSLEAGKDADLVIWSDHPLSIYAKAEKTFVDGACYFDLERDAALRKSVAAERARLVQKMLGAKAAGAPTQQPALKRDRHFHCDTVESTVR